SRRAPCISPARRATWHACGGRSARRACAASAPTSSSATECFLRCGNPQRRPESRPRARGRDSACRHRRVCSASWPVRPARAGWHSLPPSAKTDIEKLSHHDSHLKIWRYPMTMFFDPFRELDRVAGQLLDTRQGPRLMPMDLYRDGDHYVLNADLPGIDPGSVDIDVDGQLLTIRAERTPRSVEGVKWIARERSGGSFLRQLNLGQGVDIAAISASYENGVLSVVIPVSEAAKPRKIEVQTSARSEQLEAHAEPAEA